jgi:DNA-binding PadR family transcriptional regulator
MNFALKSLGRFARPAQQILTILGQGPRIPAALCRELRARCGDDIGPGTLFGTLARLERRGLVEVIPSPAAPRAYRITGLGADTLEAQLASMTSRGRQVQSALTRSAVA